MAARAATPAGITAAGEDETLYGKGPRERAFFAITVIPGRCAASNLESRSGEMISRSGGALCPPGNDGRSDCGAPHIVVA